MTLGHGPAAERLILDLSAGTVLADVYAGRLTKTLVAQGIVGSTGGLPAGVPPTGAATRPETIEVSPRVGGPTTTFTLTAQSSPAGRAERGAEILLLSGPGGSRCQPVFPGPVLMAAASGGAGGSTFQVGPAATGRATWCRGRYAASSRGAGVFCFVR